MVRSVVESEKRKHVFFGEATKHKALIMNEGF